jgi:hypothetical protein
LAFSTIDEKVVMKILKALAAAAAAAAAVAVVGLSTPTAATTCTMISGYPEESFRTKNIRLFISEVEKETKGELESSGRNPIGMVRPTALAEPDLERYTIRLPAQAFGGVNGVNG